MLIVWCLDSVYEAEAELDMRLSTWIRALVGCLQSSDTKNVRAGFTDTANCSAGVSRPDLNAAQAQQFP